jgi:DNA-binding GntR family transcriptional regulator
MIVDGQLRPGHKIAQEAISQKLDVSRIPVREALIQMERDGLLISRPNVGAFVAAFGEAVIHDHFEVVGHVQALAAERTAAIVDKPLLKQLRDLRNALAVETDPVVANDLAVEFQRVVNRACGSQRLRSVLRGLSRILPIEIVVHIPGSLELQRKCIPAMYRAVSTGRRIEETYVGVARDRAEFIVSDLRRRRTFSTKAASAS